LDAIEAGHEPLPEGGVADAGVDLVEDLAEVCDVQRRVDELRADVALVLALVEEIAGFVAEDRDDARREVRPQREELVLHLPPALGEGDLVAAEEGGPEELRR